MMDIILRDYQRECLNTILNKGPGGYLIQLATGLGKTVIFTELSKYIKGKILILSHRTELVYQPMKYLNCSKAIELGENYSNGEKVVISTIQTFCRRYEKFGKRHFEIIIIDEAHHSAAQRYREIIEHFQPNKLLGFTATPNRADNIRLDNIFDEIIFERSVKWGILNNYLSNIHCKSVNIGYSLKNVRLKMGDYQEKLLNAAVNIDKANSAIAETYFKYSKGQTIIFCVSIAHCYNIQKLIPGSKVIDSKTSKEDRKQLIDDFTNKKFRCLINCLIFTEGTDLPLIETIIIARPTKSITLYTQMVGRGLRLYTGKKELLLIDCVGAHSLNLCMAPCLFGLDIHSTSIEPNKIDSNIFDLSNFISKEIDNPKSWIKNIKNIQLFKKTFGYDMHNVNYFLNPDGSFTISFPGFKKIIPAPDKLGYIQGKNKKYKLQKVFDLMYIHLVKKHSKQITLWDLDRIKRWGKLKPTQGQIKFIRSYYPDYPIWDLNRMEASILITKTKEDESE
jgi:hypothetical protein